MCTRLALACTIVRSSLIASKHCIHPAKQDKEYIFIVICSLVFHSFVSMIQLMPIYSSGRAVVPFFVHGNGGCNMHSSILFPKTFQYEFVCFSCQSLLMQSSFIALVQSAQISSKIFEYKTYDKSAYRKIILWLNGTTPNCDTNFSKNYGDDQDEVQNST